ncbi:MAG TPA: 2-hydroxychromene-2-carboxylate isomerase [Candidatus Binatia bacterium]
MKLSFWFDFASTYSYPAAMRIEQLARARNVPLSWNAFLLSRIFRAQGWTDSPFILYPVKGRYMWRDLERICEAQRVQFCRPSQFPRNGLLAARIACRFSKETWTPAFVRAVYHANFAEDQDIAARRVIADCLRLVNQDAETVLDVAVSAEAKAMLREQTERAVDLGIFGAPTFIADQELFWGNDRLEEAVSWCQRTPK